MDSRRDHLLAILKDFALADTWSESRVLVSGHPELLSQEADTALADLGAAAAWQGTDAGTLEEHRHLLARCREIGIEAAFAEKMTTRFADELATSGDVLDGIQFSETATAAVRMASARRRPNVPLDTKLVFAALPQVDVDAEWDRLALHAPPSGTLAQAAVDDPDHDVGGTWRGIPLTVTLTNALRLAARIADAYDLAPPPPAVLALALVADPRTSAARAVLQGSDLTHADLIGLIEEILGGRLDGLWQFLDAAADAATIHKERDRTSWGLATEPGLPTHVKEPDMDGVEQLAEKVGDALGQHFEALVQLVNRFLQADTGPDFGRLLDEHPELLDDDVDRILAKSLHDAREAHDDSGERRLAERRQLLAAYRDLMEGRDPATEDQRVGSHVVGRTTSETSAGSPSPAQETKGQVGECRFELHVWETSSVDQQGYRATAFRCEVCHVGNLLEWTAMPGGAVSVGYCVFPADGNMDVSQEVAMWSIATCEGTIKQMEDDGVSVIRGVPVIGGPRPAALRKHTRFDRGPWGGN